MSRLLVRAIALLAFALPASAGATSQADDWPRLGAATTGERGRFVLRAPYRGPTKHAAERNGGWANFEINAGKDASEFWFWELPAHWNGSGWEVERGALPRRIAPVF